jgi:hypothetical protein
LRRILHSVKRWISGTARPKSDRPGLVYVFSPAKGEGHEMPPGDQLAILRRLSSFSDSEELPVTIIFVSRPLRKVPEGSRQGAVVVRYAMPDQVAKVVEQAIGETRKTHSAVLVSDRPELEKLARRERIRHLRGSTFEKAMDAVSGPLKKESREPREPREPREARPDRKPQAEPPSPRPIDSVTPAQKQTEPAAKMPPYEPPVAKKETDSAILDLIDPL